ncbi:hypothetical protein SACE_4503 [Saccharopolyspora erythraea NRRL 2338]|uniref:Uncharacterized protein n=1 Tax=Saccharopolyspora erythraea (strain ATCC 11635 / DSM 40517 / JCM 4748 / NBRC 13426 / NCIMB 8594 / NRRL 2338) TaxID=405948 RepID=A4FI97_SACEN|nr:hypothetical protein SACE_4503 [Saccharopolyspora erythraea NRRL 2338]
MPLALTITSPAFSPDSAVLLPGLTDATFKP